MKPRAACSELATSAPAGRLIVLEGMPGAGKTTLARALAAEGATVLGEYTTPGGATIPLAGHPRTDDGAAHDANWTLKAHQAATVRRHAAPVYADRDWLSALAYAYSIASTDSGRLLGQRCAWAQDHITSGDLLIPDAYLIFDISPATSLRRRSGILQNDHPWSHPGPLGRLRYFYTWPAQVIGSVQPALATALLAPAWHRIAAGSQDSRLRLLRQLGTSQ